MVDHLSSTERSRNMARVKSSDTKPELLVRSLIHQMGFRFSLHRKDLPGRPDIVLTRLRKIVFVNGCFWHGHAGCRRGARPSTNRAFWDKKINSNTVRDAQNLRLLSEQGWQPLVVWECQTRDISSLRKQLCLFLG